MRPGDKKQHQQKKKALYSGNGRPAGELDWERDTQASRGRAPPAHPAHPHGEEEAGAGSRDVRSLLAGNEALAPPPRLLPHRPRARKPSLGAGTPGGRPEDMAGDAVQVGDLSSPAGRPDGAEDPGHR